METEYNENIIVGVLFRSRWSWYVTEKEIWFLDITKFRIPDSDEVFSGRFNIPIVNENSAQQFLTEIKDFLVDDSELTEPIAVYEQVAESWEEISELCPSLFVDFDNKTLYSLFLEPIFF